MELTFRHPNQNSRQLNPMPDESDTFGRSSTIKAIDEARTAEARALGCLAEVMRMFGSTKLEVDSFQADNGKPARITPSGNKYILTAPVAV